MKHLNHFATAMKLQEKTLRFVAVKNCRVEEYAMRGQTVIATSNETTPERAMLNNWSLQGLLQNGMKYESAAAGEEKTSGGAINKLGSYSYRSIKRSDSPKKNDDKKNATDVV